MGDRPLYYEKNGGQTLGSENNFGDRPLFLFFLS